MRTRLRLAAFALALISLGTACTPEEIALFFESTAPTRDVLTDDELLRLRMCESTDNYQATNPSGKYRGAYQFDQTTWDDVAGRHFEWLVSLDPATVEPWWQDAMARALWSERGRQPWPHCGLKV
ncbi:MAG: transglycosylase family protein [Actinomycetota bacterium]